MYIVKVVLSSNSTASQTINEVLLIILLTTEIQRYFNASEILLNLNLCLLFCSVAPLKLSQMGKKQKCLTTISILFLQVAISSYLIWKNARPTKPISDISLSYEKVYQVLSTLQTKKVCGLNGIGPSLLQACASPDPTNTLARINLMRGYTFL